MKYFVYLIPGIKRPQQHSYCGAIESDSYIGRTEADSPEVDNEVIIPKSSGYARIGDFAQFKVTEAGPFDLYGELVD